MKLLRFLKTNSAALALVVFALGCLLLVAAVHIAPGAERYAYAPYAFSILQPDSTEETPIDDYAGVRRSYVFTIPEGGVTETGARVMVYLRHTNAGHASHRKDPGQLLGQRPGSPGLCREDAARRAHAGL